MASLKTLIVCLSSDLPSEADRDPECLYFVYNTLELYMGKPLFGENFCIVDTMPTEEPNVDQVYICLDDGYVKVYDDYGTHIIAQIQTAEMIDVLRKAGTSYFYNSKERYIDVTDRSFVLPFNDGTFNMVVDFHEDTVIDETTVIRYNPKTGHFEISSEANDLRLKNSGLVGGETPTAKITVDDGKIKGDVKISNTLGNIIKVAQDGMYVTVRNKVTQQEYNSWKEAISAYRVSLDASLQIVEAQLVELEELVSKENIERMVNEKLEQVIPFIEEAIIRYNELAEKIDEVIIDAKAYTDEKVGEAREEINERIEEAIKHPWGAIDGGLLPVEYAYVVTGLMEFLKSKEPSNEDFAYIITALSEYKKEEPLSNEDYVYISTALAAYLKE